MRSMILAMMTSTILGNAILAWTGTSFTLSSETASAGELVFERQP